MSKGILKVLALLILALFTLQSCKTTHPAVTDAKVQMKNGDFQAAKKYLEKALKDNPNEPDALFYMGKIAEDGEQFSEMKEWFDKYIKADQSKSHKAEVEQSLEQAYKKTYYNGATTFNNAVKLLQAEQADKAAKIFARSIQDLELATTLADKKEPWSLLGKVYVQIDNKDKAIESFRKVLTLDKKNIEALELIAILLQESEKSDEAKKAYNDVLAVEPNNSKALNGLSAIYQKEGNQEKALEVYNMMLAGNPKDVNVLFNKGVLLNNMKKTSEAIATFEKVVELTPTDFEAKVILANLYNQNKEYQKTIDLLVESYPTFADAEKKKANGAIWTAYIKLGNGKEAKKYFTE